MFDFNFIISSALGSCNGVFIVMIYTYVGLTLCCIICFLVTITESRQCDVYQEEHSSIRLGIIKSCYYTGVHYNKHMSLKVDLLAKACCRSVYP